MTPDLRGRIQAFRDRVHSFYHNDLPDDLRRKAADFGVFSKGDYVQWMQLLHSKGWAIGHWPKIYGGDDLAPLERFVLEDELARLRCPWIIPFGVKYVGPVIYGFGSPEQKARFLPRIATTEDWWAQGYSEPGAGSDLAALRTRARREGDHYIVSGQKTWTTYAQWADWMFCLARTSEESKPQLGISFLLIDMKSSGISVKPIPTMDGYSHVNEVWLDDVRVPIANRVGEEGAGWGYGKYLLKNERTNGSLVGLAWEALQCLKSTALGLPGGLGAKAASLRQRIGEFELRFLALEEVAYKAVCAMMDGQETGAEASVIKIRGPELHQDISTALIEVLALAGVAYDTAPRCENVHPLYGMSDAKGLIKQHLYGRASTIFGGSSEVQRTIVAKSVLGL